MSNTESGPSKDKPASEGDAAALDELRRRIDELDQRLVALLNQRAEVVVEIGRLKRDSNVPIYAPHREAAVLAKVLTASRGPLPARTIEGIYRELMSGSFALERPLRIGYLGPPGTFSHAAATAQFGSSVEFDDVHAIGAVFDAVRRGHVDYGVVPIENSTGGGITESLDAFLESAGELSIYAEVLISIRHNLLANCAPGEVRRIHSKPEIFAQCRRWLADQYPNARQLAASSSSQAVQTAVEEIERDPGCGAAAIGSELAGQIYGANLLYADIEDNPQNVTRFFVVARETAQPTGDDKTSMMFRTADTPGALVKVLSVFDRAEINLTHIDKRPSRRTNWDYTFFIDAVGHRDDPNLAYAIREAGAHCRDLAVLGSYPRAKRVL
ncbi:prephenate dehydratase [Haliangium sp.]|uniref:prephenate dehydratase n=1 Tax=Haliangium sp. TaxID=2663208 RepID=UPI003D10832B